MTYEPQPTDDEIRKHLATKKAKPPVTEFEYQDMIARCTAAPRSYGFLNAYFCQDGCKAITVTIDRDQGVTPFMIACPKCEAAGRRTKGAIQNYMARSAMYRLPDDATEEMARYEFYRPSYGYYRALTHESTRNHVESGGLLFRKIGDLNHIF